MSVRAFLSDASSSTKDMTSYVSGLGGWTRFADGWQRMALALALVFLVRAFGGSVGGLLHVRHAL